jgi:hypothetical protein
MREHLTNAGPVGPLIYLPASSVYAMVPFHRIQEVSKL